MVIHQTPKLLDLVASWEPYARHALSVRNRNEIPGICLPNCMEWFAAQRAMVG